MIFLVLLVTLSQAGERGYDALVDAYRRGAVEDSVNGLAAIDTDAVEAAARRHVRLATQRAADPAFVRAAAMLHAEAAIRCWTNLRLECGALLESGRLLVDAAAPSGKDAESFRRRWYAATAMVQTMYVAPDEALDYFDHAVRTFPDDVALLTAAGWFAERLSNSAALPQTTMRHAQALRRRHQRTAERFLAAALAVAPDAAEPSLRLARLEVAANERESARKRLASLVARDDLQPPTAYLARLMLGDMHERDGNGREAARLYREALGLDPVGQSARVALAHVLYAAGDALEAAAVIEPLLTRTGKDERNDPWSEYLVGYPAAGQLLLEQLRREVQR
jgi:tetratricopeptide (TPR) repeat protein